MASRVAARFGRSPAEPPAFRRTGRWRHFFAALAVLYALIALAGFLPNLLLAMSGGMELSRAAHFHGAVMASWLVLLVVQAALPAAGRLDLHRRLGVTTSLVALLVWLTMIFVSLHQIGVRDPPEGAFLFNILLLQTQAVILFPFFFVWAILARRRPGWHKRLIVMAMIVPMGASVDRMAWLPVGGVEHEWPRFLYLDLLLLPLLVFDLVSIRRIHPATLAGAAILLAAQAIVAIAWDTPAWHALAHRLTSLLP